MSESTISLNIKQILKLAGDQNAEFATSVEEALVEQIEIACDVVGDELKLKDDPTVTSTPSGFEVDLDPEITSGADATRDISAILGQDMDPARRRRILEIAEDMHTKEGSLEIDPDARIAEGDDNGAYVESWVWVPFAGTDFDREAQDD